MAPSMPAKQLFNGLDLDQNGRIEIEARALELKKSPKAA